MLGPMWDVRVSLWPWLVLRDARARALFETTALRPGALLRSSAAPVTCVTSRRDAPRAVSRA